MLFDYVLLHGSYFIPNLNPTRQTEYVDGTAHSAENREAEVLLRCKLSTFTMRDIDDLQGHTHFDRHHTPVEANNRLRLQLPIYFDGAEHTKKGRVLADDNDSLGLIVEL